MSEEEVKETICPKCTKEQCDKGIVRCVDGTYHCADED